jgi:hypothetical protein
VSQVSHSTIAQPIRARRNQRFGVLAPATMAITAAGVAAILIVTSFSSAPTVQTPPAHRDLVDGWMPAVAAAHAARLARMQDGYLPGLLAARDAGDPVDGYLPGLLAARGSGEAVDGWESALTGRDQSSDVRDGWESGLLH